MVIPTGTVTLLFTDIEGSTRLWEKHPDAMTIALQRHDALMRLAIESAGGFVFKTVGDAFCAAFTSASEAVEAAATAQRALHSETWPDQACLRVRMALHTGECEERNRDYFGPTVNRTARLEATAHGGQVVMSQTTAALVRDHLPKETVLMSLGSHLLKDLDRSEDVFQLTVSGIPADFPPLRSRSADNPTTLPEPVSTFVGRDSEVAEVVTLLRDNRLVTLAGPGGVGKTRLAIEVGRSVLPDTPDGVWLVELATVTDSELVATEVLSELGIGVQSDTEALDTLVDVLASQGRLVILDNCEQVLDGCATLTDAILRQCHDITILATSREPLRIGGESIYRVPSLSLPPEQVDDRTDLVGSGAVTLLVERAIAQDPAFSLSDEDAPLVASICRRLDGIPLALELATARLRSMSLAQLHDRLEHRFELLTGGSRVVLPRQQTLRALVDWSYDLLTDSEQALFRGLSVFVGGFELEAAEEVCALDGIAEYEIANLLTSLVDKSMVVARPIGNGVRYRLLETLRQFGAELLGKGDDDELSRLRNAHATYYLGYAELAAPNLTGRSQDAWYSSIKQNDLNLRSAIRHLLAHGRPSDALRILGLLQSYWVRAGNPMEVKELVDRALATTTGLAATWPSIAVTICRAKLLLRDHPLSAEACARAAVEQAREAGELVLEAQAKSAVCYTSFFGGHADAGLRFGADAVAIARQLGDLPLLGETLMYYAAAAWEVHPELAENLYREGILVAGRSGDMKVVGALASNYGCVLLARGRIAEARQYLEQSLDLARFPVDLCVVLGNLGFVLLAEGDVGAATTSFAHSLRQRHLSGASIADLPYQALGLAICASRSGDLERAAVLHGAASALIEELEVPWERPENKFRDEDIAVLRSNLGGDFERLVAVGHQLARDEIIRLLLMAE